MTGTKYIEGISLYSWYESTILKYIIIDIIS